MSWTDSLIKLRNFEIEGLRKRMMEIVERRTTAEAAIKALELETAREVIYAKQNAEAGWYLIGFREGVKQRRAKLDAELRGIAAEEAGARDALSEAFEGLKKVEKTAANMAAAKAKDLAHRETQAMDEQALRRRVII
jgi:flagellar FliJ protein